MRMKMMHWPAQARRLRQPCSRALSLATPETARLHAHRAEEDAVVRHTEEGEVHGVRLRLITPTCPLHSVRDEADLPFPDPWWAFCWPGGQALTRFVRERPKVVRGQRVLDVGSGCGSVSIACLKAGAAHVTANDIDPLAGAALRVNLALNGLSGDALVFEPRNLAGSGAAAFAAFDAVLCGDMLYDADVAPALLKDLSEHRGVYFGDPGRTYCPPQLAEGQLQARYEHGEDGFSCVQVFKLNV